MGEPLVDYALGHNMRLVIRERESTIHGQKFVASIRYIHPPQPGAYLVTYAFGRTREEAETRALASASYEDAQARQ